MGIQEVVDKAILEKFKEYVKWTPTTSIHKTDKDAITESLLGIFGEYDEYWNGTGELQLGTTELESQKELGDICYYLGLYCYKVGILDELEIIDTYEEFPDALATLYENYKKVVRENDWDIFQTKEVRRKTIIEAVNQLLSWVLTECEDRDWDFFDILDLNQEKLTTRKENGTIEGDGDDR